MTVHSIRRIQTIPAPFDKVWSFFTDPAKLVLITPAYMQFKVLHPAEKPQVYAGQLIEYTLRPVLGIRLYWMTEITQVFPRSGPGASVTPEGSPASGANAEGANAFSAEEAYFVDESRRGPYSLWHHQHHFRSVPGGIEMTDIVHYEIPFGPLGNLAHALFVRRQLHGVFDYRFAKVEEIFGRYAPPA